MTCIDCGSETEDGACFTCASDVNANQMHDFSHTWAEMPEECTACAGEAAESEFNS